MLYNTYTEITSYIKLVSPINLTVSLTESLKPGGWKRKYLKLKERQIWSRSIRWRINYKDRNLNEIILLLKIVADLTNLSFLFKRKRIGSAGVFKTIGCVKSLKRYRLPHTLKTSGHEQIERTIFTSNRLISLSLLSATIDTAFQRVLNDNWDLKRQDHRAVFSYFNYFGVWLSVIFPFFIKTSGKFQQPWRNSFILSKAKANAHIYIFLVFFLILITSRSLNTTFRTFGYHSYSFI